MSQSFSDRPNYVLFFFVIEDKVVPSLWDLNMSIFIIKTFLCFSFSFQSNYAFSFPVRPDYEIFLGKT